MDQIEQISSINIAVADKRFYTITRHNGRYRTFLFNPDTYPDKQIEQDWTTLAAPDRERLVAYETNRIESPWFLGANDSVAAGNVFWTRPRYIERAGSPGITAALGWTEDQNGKNNAVIAFDVPLKNIFATISEIPIGDNSSLFLFRDDNIIFRMDADTNQFPADSLAFYYHPSEVPLIEKALQKRIAESVPDGSPVRFKSKGVPYWAGFGQIDKEHSRLLIGIIIPETDALDAVQLNPNTMIIISLIVFAAGLFVAGLFIRKYRQQGEGVFSDPADIDTRISELIHNGENNTCEFKSTMRMNLKSGKPGKEIELAWLKAAVAFMNSGGGVLLIGVKDDGEITGLEADEFDNHDRCLLHFKNLINQHIGVGFTSYLNFFLHERNGKTIAVLECAASEQPVFLLNKEEESFYIRSGPSSVKLQPSQVLDYMKNR